MSTLGEPRAGSPPTLRECGHLLFDGVRDVVLGEQFADASLLAFGARAVVAPDVEDDGVLADTELFQPVHELADLRVGVLDETGEHLHQPPLEGPLRFGNAVPRRHRVGSRRQLRVRRDPAEFLLALEHALAVLVPAVVELPFVLVRPLREDVVRTVGATGCPVHQERLVGREGLVPLDPGEPLVDHVFGQVVFLAVRRFDRVLVLVQPGLPLRRFAGEEAVEVVEPVAGGPAVERAHRGGLVRGGVVPLPERRGFVAVVVEHLGHGGGRLRDDAGVAVEVGRPLGNGPVTDPVVVPAGQEGGSAGGADRGRVKRVVADSRVTQPSEGRCVDLSAESVRDTEAHVVDQHDEDVRCTRLESLGFLSPLHRGFLQRRAGHARRGDRREREDGTSRFGRWRALLTPSFTRPQRSHDAEQSKNQRQASKWKRFHRQRLPLRFEGVWNHGVGRCGFSCGNPPSSMSKSGSKSVALCAPRKLGWALIHSLGFIWRA